jgi:hypothetical protein
VCNPTTVGTKPHADDLTEVVDIVGGNQVQPDPGGMRSFRLENVPPS